MNTSKTRISLALACSLALIAAPAAFAGKDGDNHLKKMDTDGDGQISRVEHATGAQQMFTEADANRDGIVTAAEMDAKMASRGDKPGKEGKSSTEKMQMIDQNSDGQLTAAEHLAGSEKMFAHMDADGDGALSMEECKEGKMMKKKDR